VSYGTNLNFGGGDSQWTDLSLPGQIWLSNTSSDSATTLETLQPSSFTLATIKLTGLALTTTPMTLTIDANLANPAQSISSLSDEYAHTLDLVNVTNASLAVIPEPSVTASLLGAAAMGFCMLRRRFSRGANVVA
jgi:hypothetical protein